MVMTYLGTGLIDFQGGYLTAAQNDEMDIEIEGWRQGVRIYLKTVNIYYNSPTWIDTDFLGVDAIRFIPEDEEMSNPIIAVDNITYSASAVPLPSTLLLLASGLLSLTGWRRKLF